MLTGTPHFTVREALNASGGDIPAELQDNAQAVLEWLEAARVYLGRPIIITSLYRSPEHNATVAGHANNSQHMRALGTDFDVLGMTNHAAVSRILAGVDSGAIPTFHQIITYTTDHHVHVGVPGEEWSADEQALLQTAPGAYTPLTASMLAQLANSSAFATATATVAQVADVATLHPVAVALVAAFFIIPAAFGGHWT